MVLTSTVEFDERKTQGNINIKETQDFYIRKNVRKNARKAQVWTPEVDWSRRGQANRLLLLNYGNLEVTAYS